MMIRCQFTKVGDIAYVSHLDILNILHRGINRSGMKIKYSEGFNPHPKLAFSPALSLGVNSIAEFVDIDFDENINPKDLIKILNPALPDGIEITKAKEYDGKKSLSAQITHNMYKIAFDNHENDLEALEKRINQIIASEEIIVQKANKKGQIKDHNQKEKIYDMNYNKGANSHILIAVLQNSPDGALKVKEFMDIINKKEGNSIDIPSSCHEFRASEIIKMSSIAIVDGEIIEVM